jgi:hypothetical protein
LFGTGLNSSFSLKKAAYIKKAISEDMIEKINILK